MRPAEGSLRTLIARPFHDVNFKHLLRFLGAWNFALYLATPFFSVYMLKRLEMDLSWVVGLIVLGRLVNIIFLRVWGSLADRISNKSILAVSGPLCLLCILGWTFTTLPELHVLTLPLLVLLHILMGVAMAGITLAMGNISLKLAPLGEGTNYLAAASFVTALAAGIAPMLSGPLVDFFVARRLSWTLTWTGPEGSFIIETLNLQQWDFLFMLSGLLGLYALHRLSMVREVGEIEEKMVLLELVSAFGREVRDFSTVATLRNFVVGAGVTFRRRNALDEDANGE
jgi:MFS family permease